MSETIIYTKTGCPYCARTVQEYKAKRIQFKEINTSQDQAARQLCREKYGASKVPVVVQDGKVIQIGDSAGMG
ncbi:MAG: glutaredoxin family protein [Bacillota bacterium]|jgi:glutaredoxin 3